MEMKAITFVLSIEHYNPDYLRQIAKLTKKSDPNLIIQLHEVTINGLGSRINKIESF